MFASTRQLKACLTLTHSPALLVLVPALATTRPFRHLKHLADRHGQVAQPAVPPRGERRRLTIGNAWSMRRRRRRKVGPRTTIHVCRCHAARTTRPLLAHLGSDAFVSDLQMVYMDVIDERRSECGNVRRENLQSGRTGEYLPLSPQNAPTEPHTGYPDTPTKSKVNGKGRFS